MLVRAALLDALTSLSRGHLIVCCHDDPSTFGIHLDGVPHIATVFRSLVDRGWIRLARPVLLGEIEYWTLTPLGLDALREGRAWYYSLPVWKRVAGRAGLPVAA